VAYVEISDMTPFMGQASTPTPPAPTPVSRSRPIGAWFGKGRPFGLSQHVGGFCQAANTAVIDAILLGNETGDVGKLKYVLADIAKTFAMGPSHATASEVEKYFSRPDARPFIENIWNEFAADTSMDLMMCAVDLPPFDVLDRTPAPAGPGIIPGSRYEEMRRAPAVVVQTTPGVIGTPKGSVDSIKLQPDGSVRVDGWALVPSSPGTPVRVEVMAELATGAKTQTRVAVPTGMPRPDVAKAQNVTGNHGFVAVIPPQENGTYAIYAYGVNQATSENALLEKSPQNVMVAKPLTSASTSVVAAPTIQPSPAQTQSPTYGAPSFQLPSLPQAHQVSAPQYVATRTSTAPKASADKMVLIAVIGLSGLAVIGAIYAMTREQPQPQSP